MYIIHGKWLDKVCYAWVRSTVVQADALEDVVIVTLRHSYQRYRQCSQLMLESDKRLYQRIPVLLRKVHQTGRHWDFFS